MINLIKALEQCNGFEKKYFFILIIQKQQN